MDPVPLVPSVEAKDLILGFDVDFDVPLRHGECLGRLEMLGAFDRGTDEVAEESTSIERLAEYVGASWCRIVRDDVGYRIVQGLEAAAESRPHAEALSERVGAAAPGALPALCAYAAARWYDGAGKIYFRMGDFTTARLSFDKAVELAERAGLMRCLPDMRSNQVRAAFDEREMVGSPGKMEDLRKAYEALVKETDERLAARGFDPASIHHELGESWKELETRIEARSDLGALDLETGPLSRSFATRRSVTWSREDREMWRGYCSVLHNLSLAHQRDPATGAGPSGEASRRAAAIAWALGDRYRVAQALNHQALLCERAEDDVRAELLCRHVLMLGWQRGRRIANQMLSRIEGRRRRFDLAISRLSGLFEQIRRDRERRGGDLGADVQFQRFTVSSLKQVIGEAGPAAPPAALEEAKRLLDREESATVRSVRKVVKVSTYKAAYSADIQPFFLRRVEGALRDAGSRPDAWTEAISLVEESSGRELLDVLREASRPKVLGKHHLTEPLPLPGDYRVAPKDDDGTRSGVRSVPVSDGDPESAAFRAQKEEIERAALQSPIETAPHNDEIGLDLRRFTAAHEGVCVVRYFHHGEEKDKDGKSAPRGLGAYVFRDGAPPAFVPLDLVAARDLVRRMAANMDSRGDLRCPGPDFAIDMWEVFFAPLWKHVAPGCTEEGAGGALPAHLVVVPAGELFGLPLHAAFVPSSDARAPDAPLCAVVPLSFSTSATVFVNRGRYLLAKQPIDATDDLCVLAPRSRKVLYPGELVGVEWDEEHFHIAGVVPEPLAERGGFKYWGPGTREGLARLISEEPEVFVFAGHGKMHGDGDLGLELEDGILSHYQIPSRMRLPRNKLTVLAACVTGQGAHRTGGEVSGFLRAFMGAGAGALGVSLWAAETRSMADATRALLRAASPKSGHPRLDVVTALHEHHREAMQGKEGQERLIACPLVLYL